MSQLIIRQAEASDCRELAELDRVCFNVPWSLAAFEAEFKYENEAFYVAAQIDGQLVGYMGMRMIFDEGHITNVAVHPGFRRRHIAKAMMSVFIAEGNARGITSFTLEVRESNEPAIRLYESFGFRSAGLRRNYYPDNHEDAVIMWRYEDEGRKDTDTCN
ncbi:MAG: ribosomal protein S18-alanine N-acetyltransferase [Firmicutes bacterium]|nr:ribosomal protein S18-alanine N-acetyltransferase [Bacillota bacterium]